MLTAIQPGTIAIGLSTLFAVGFCHQKAYSKQFDASNVTQDNIYANTKIIENLTLVVKVMGRFIGINSLLKAMILAM